MSWWKISFECDDITQLELQSQNLLSKGATAIQQLSENKRETYFDRENLSKLDLELLLSNLGIKSFEISEIKQENWLENAEDFFQPLEVGELKFDFIWEMPQEKLDSDHITILPGMGFGSGHHPTTTMILELIQSKTISDIQPKKILDFGTGSGILSIALNRLFSASKIDAIDNDRQAILNAKDNFLLNNSKVNISDRLLSELTVEYDLIVANIFLSVLTGSRLELDRLLTKDGLLVLSGITSNQLHELKESYSTWNILDEKKLDDWHALVLRR